MLSRRIINRNARTFLNQNAKHVINKNDDYNKAIDKINNNLSSIKWTLICLTVINSFGYNVYFKHFILFNGINIHKHNKDIVL
jgi:hypothetical protein